MKSFITAYDVVNADIPTEKVEKFYKSALVQSRQNNEKFKIIELINKGDFVSLLKQGKISKLYGDYLSTIAESMSIYKTVALEYYPNTIKKIATFLEVDKKLIKEILENGTEKYYDVFHIPKKSGGQRTIEAPKPELKHIQYQILYKLLYRFQPAENAHGFIKHKSIVSNAMQHQGKKFLMKLDLKDYFPSITRTMLQGAILPILTKDTALIIQGLIELCLLDGRLPQGAPTSPAWTNIAMVMMDYSLSGLARKHNLVYTRYADDLCFSSDEDNLKTFFPIILSIIDSFGLSVNKKKIGFYKDGQRMTVTGLIINHPDAVSVPRHRRMQIRAKLHNIITGKIPLDRVNMAKLMGEVNFIRMANPKQGEKFIEKLNIVREMLNLPLIKTENNND